MQLQPKPAIAATVVLTAYTFTWPAQVPIHPAMVRFHAYSSNPQIRWSRQGLRLVIVIAAPWLATASGCGLPEATLPNRTSTEIIRGEDSAGAAVEIERRGDDLTNARVTDVVLGTSEAEVIFSGISQIEFTIEFPAGATISYSGVIEDDGTSSALAIAGTWKQHSAGVFGEDSGTWAAPAVPIEHSPE